MRTFDRFKEEGLKIRQKQQIGNAHMSAVYGLTDEYKAANIIGMNATLSAEPDITHQTKRRSDELEKISLPSLPAAFPTDGEFDRVISKFLELRSEQNASSTLYWSAMDLRDMDAASPVPGNHRVRSLIEDDVYGLLTKRFETILEAASNKLSPSVVAVREVLRTLAESGELGATTELA
ncbi:hypothetical protein HDU86_005067 [Geranomyces michiganensis]|nr:hypothetical protein HDU86_005067 [Geranomyces michiganensis]